MTWEHFIFQFINFLTIRFVCGKMAGLLNMASVALSALRAETAVRERSDWPSSSNDDEDAFVELSPQQNLYRSTMAHFTPCQNGGRFGGKISASLETFLSSFFCRHLQK